MSYLNHRGAKGTERVFLCVLCVLAVSFLISCQPTPTPLPVDIPPQDTETLAPDAATAQPLRYALDMNTAGLITEGELAQIRASAQVDVLTTPINAADLGVRYDLMAGYGDLPGGTRSPVIIHVALIVQPTRPPLDNPAIASVLRHSINPQSLVADLQIPGVEASPDESAPASQIRLELANAGWPDGFNLALAQVALPGAKAIIDQLATAGMTGGAPLMAETDIQTAFTSAKLDAAVIGWRTPEERQSWAALVGENNVIDLYSIPISYLAVDGLNITFSEEGWPLIHQ
jgi:hypothetical protein